MPGLGGCGIRPRKLVRNRLPLGVLEGLNSLSVDYGYDTTIPCKGETLEVGALTRAVTKEFFHLTTFVSNECYYLSIC